MNRLRLAPALLAIAATALVGGASGSLGGPAFAAIGGVIGALWGLGLVWVTGRLNRSESRGPKWTNATLFATALIAGLVTGAGFMAELLMDAALDTRPQFFTDMIRGAIGEAEALPFYLFNTPLEWLLIPSALLLTWSNPRRRRLILAALVLWTFHRVWTYTLFVPQITDWSQGTPGTPLTPSQLEDARTWVDLSAIRSMIDLTSAVLVLLAAVIPGARDGHPDIQERHRKKQARQTTPEGQPLPALDQSGENRE